MLSRYRVLDLTDEGAMICGQILGDLGADVILVEPPHGAQARRTGPFVNNQPELNRSLNYWSLNRNKRGITIDLEKEGSKESLLKLVKSCDIMVESFAPGHLERLGECGDHLGSLSRRGTQGSV